MLDTAFHPVRPANCVRISVPDFLRSRSELPIDDQAVVLWLEQAGKTAMAMPNTGFSTRIRVRQVEIIREAIEGYGWTEPTIRMPVPSSQRIDQMDHIYGWLEYIPADRYVLRRIVGMRSLLSPRTDRHILPWGAIARGLGADHSAVKRWHAQGIVMITRALRQGWYEKSPISESKTAQRIQ